MHQILNYLLSINEAKDSNSNGLSKMKVRDLVRQFRLKRRHDPKVTCLHKS